MTTFRTLVFFLVRFAWMAAAGFGAYSLAMHGYPRHTVYLALTAAALALAVPKRK